MASNSTTPQIDLKPEAERSIDQKDTKVQGDSKISDGAKSVAANFATSIEEVQVGSASWEKKMKVINDVHNPSSVEHDTLMRILGNDMIEYIVSICRLNGRMALEMIDLEHEAKPKRPINLKMQRVNVRKQFGLTGEVADLVDDRGLDGKMSEAAYKEFLLEPTKSFADMLHKFEVMKVMFKPGEAGGFPDFLLELIIGIEKASKALHGEVAKLENEARSRPSITKAMEGIKIAETSVSKQEDVGSEIHK
ncbi:hypothetical protein LTS10_011860 [Elasticomyces elasticus]|nr:hypothetical protein LTS10_011860 [Elasticomyces elasticus]